MRRQSVPAMCNRTGPPDAIDPVRDVCVKFTGLWVRKPFGQARCKVMQAIGACFALCLLRKVLLQAIETTEPAVLVILAQGFVRNAPVAKNDFRTVFDRSEL